MSSLQGRTHMFRSASGFKVTLPKRQRLAYIQVQKSIGLRLDFVEELVHCTTKLVGFLIEWIVCTVIEMNTLNIAME